VTCKKEFPHLVQMHKKYAKDGLVAVSVALDDTKDENFPKVRERIQKFLDKQGAEFPNLILAAPSEEWTRNLKIDGPPAVFVFNRENRWVKRLPLVDDKGRLIEDVNYATVEKVVQELLKK
jgi:hypothetical protein